MPVALVAAEFEAGEHPHRRCESSSARLAQGKLMVAERWWLDRDEGKDRVEDEQGSWRGGAG